MELDPKKINGYSYEELMDFLDSGKYKFSDFQRAGLNYVMQDKIRKVLEEIEKKKEKEKQDWNCACNVNSIDSYRYYLSQHEDEDAQHTFEANMNIEKLIIAQRQLYEDLFKDMRENILDYKYNTMQVLFGKYLPSEEQKNEDSPVGRFLKADLKLTFKDLYDSGILPQGKPGLEKAIFMNDFEVPQIELEQLAAIPTDRTDVYFLGLPECGKSCVLAGLLNYMHYAGAMHYVPSMNDEGKDGCLPYYNALIQSLSEYKAPFSTALDTFSYMQLDLGVRRDREVTVMELSGEAFNALAEAHTTGPEVWQQLGLGRCLKNDTPKTLFFLIDYRCIIGKSKRFTAHQQDTILNNALRVFSSDGTGKNHDKNCTMSKVQTVAVIITKSDLMDDEEGRPLTNDERMKIAFKHLEKGFAQFMNDLIQLCEKYGINANSKTPYKPYVITYSLGQFFVGNSVLFDDADSKRLADFIVAATERRRRGPLDFLF